jgi:Sulfatase-modifying factor enzyme 1
MNDAKRARTIRTIAGAALGAAGLLAAYQAGRAKADGIPTTPALVYTGFLEEKGDAVSGERAIGVSIVDGNAKALPGCTALNEKTQVDAGQFSATFGDDCAKAIQAQGPDLSVQVTVGGKPVGGPVKIAAVPFAVDAERANGLTEKARTDLLYASCPPGYAASTPAGKTFIVCQNGFDEVVKVGTDATAFWIDRYEATVWKTRTPAPNESPLFTIKNDSDVSLPATGPFAEDKRFALSVKEQTPSRFITWLQAEATCRASGKRLPTRIEWLTAVQGTDDPDVPNDGLMDSHCHTLGVGPRATGNAALCVSRWGAEDMIGNVDEWIGEWHVRPTDNTSTVAVGSWPSGDVSINVENNALQSNMQPVEGQALVEQRGGYWTLGTGAGSFTMIITNGPITANGAVGFRCVIPR